MQIITVGFFCFDFVSFVSNFDIYVCKHSIILQFKRGGSLKARGVSVTEQAVGKSALLRTLAVISFETMTLTWWGGLCVPVTLGDGSVLRSS